MSRTADRAVLRAEIRQRADIENDPHITDAEVNRFINQSYARLHAMVVQLAEDDYTTSQSLVTVAGTEEYALTSFYKLVSVEASVNGVWRQMQRWTWADRARYLNVPTWGLPGQPVAYRLVGVDKIRFMPVPDAVYSVTAWYIAPITDLANDSEKVDGRDGWEEWIVLDAAIKCMTKDETDARALIAERDALWQAIRPQAATKDQARPDVVQDVTRQYDSLDPRRWW